MSRQEIRSQKNNDIRTGTKSTSTSGVHLETKKQHSRTKGSKLPSARPHRGAASLKIFDHDLDTRTANMLCSQSVLQIDTETEGLDFRKHKLMLVQIATKARRVYVVQNPNITSFNLAMVLESQYPKKIFHQSTFY